MTWKRVVIGEMGEEKMNLKDIINKIFGNF